MDKQNNNKSGTFEPLVLQNVVYKKAGNVELGLDIYGPTEPTEGPTPALFYVHGGGWGAGTRELPGLGELIGFVNGVRALGVTVVPVSYRLTNDTVKFPTHINDVCDAIRFVVKHSDDYNIDPQRIGVFGGSAGGHLSLLAGLCTTEFGEDPELSSTGFDVKCVLDFCGPTDLATIVGEEDSESMADAVNGLLVNFLGASIADNPAIYASASPVTHVGKNLGLSVLIIQGKSDEIVPYAQAEKMYEKLKNAGYNVKYLPVDNANHGFGPSDSQKPITPGMPQIIDECVAFVKSNLI